MVQPTHWLSKLLLVLAACVGVGSVIAFAGWPLGALRLARPAWSEPSLLMWDTALSFVFFAQHSGMIRRGVRARMARVIAPIYLPAIYAIASGLALAAVVLLWQPSNIRVLSLTGPARVVAHGLSIAAIGLFVWGLITLRSFDPLGIAPLTSHLRAKSPKPCAFVVRGAYRLVRHPLYLAVIVLIWACPDGTADRLLFNALWTAWIVGGTVLEEADLVAELGDRYREYRRTVPMLIPSTGSRGEGYVITQLVVMALVVFGPSTVPGMPAWPTSIARAASASGITLIVIGIALAVAGIATLGRNLSALPRPKHGATLVERGPYRLVRHPMYAGAALAAIGWALVSHGWLTIAYAALLFGFFALKARREERWLRNEVAGYTHYQQHVRRLIPFIY